MSVELIIVLLGGSFGYLISLWLHPYARCRACGGTSKHFGAVFSRNFRVCRRCKGTGRKPRFGCYLFRPDLVH
ncbi:MAG: hypothetical protein ACRDO7_08400 [Nocardioidaceae bacterium]